MAQQTNKQDQYGLFSLFPMFVYRGKLQSHNKWKEEVVPIITRRYQEASGSNSNTKDEGGRGIWNCDCYTSFFEESMTDHSKETEINIQNLLNDLSNNIQEAIKAAEFYPHAFMVSQQWFNAYAPKQNQEAHNHIPSHLSGCYYLQYDPALHHNTAFLNPLKHFCEAPRHNKYFFDPTLSGYGCYKEEMRLNIEEGDVVIFPSQMEHFVPKQPGLAKNPDGKLYITYSFNIDMVSENEATKQLGMPNDQDSIPNATTNAPNNNIPPGPSGQQPGPSGQQPAPADGQGPGDQSQGNAGEWSSDWF